MKYRFIVSVCMALAAASLMADVKLPALFSNGAVLQRSADTPVFGTADQDEEVTVKIGDVSGKARTDRNGKWLVKLDLSRIGHGPFDMIVEGKNKLVRKDILVGEVWLCSGQSNMQWVVSRALNAKAEIAASENSMIRCFTVKRTAMDEPTADYSGNWQAASPKSTGGFTAVGYFFAREVQKELGVPVGIVNSSWGGSPIEAWTSRQSLDAFAAQKKQADAMDNDFDTYDDQLKKFSAGYSLWQENHQRRESDLVLKENTDWKTFRFPAGVPGNGGVVTVRRSVDIPKNLDSKALTINLGRFSAPARFFWNGKEVGEISFAETIANEANRIMVPAAGVKPGLNEFSIRFFTSEPGVSRAGGFNVQGGPELNGQWEYAYLGEFPELTAEAKKTLPKRLAFRPPQFRLPARLYNGMIHPLVPYGFSGVIWYQGEANAGRNALYREATSALIEDWRKAFGREFPFYWCQLANYQDKTDNPGANSNWALLRESQTQALSIPQTGQAVLIDIGESGDIHPLNKQDAGKRLAAVALAETYDRQIPCSGPLYKGMKIEGDRIRLSFDFIEGGLIARELPETYNVRLAEQKTAKLKRNSPQSELEGFAIAGADGKWAWADARIEGDNVVVWSGKVKEPTQVRYAWANNPTCNLYNKTGFPAIPFRTNK